MCTVTATRSQKSWTKSLNKYYGSVMVYYSFFYCIYYGQYFEKLTKSAFKKVKTDNLNFSTLQLMTCLP